MSNIHLFLNRLLASFHGRRAEADLAREIQAHLQLLEETFVAGGMSPEEARFAARRAFGNIEQTKELQRDARSFRWLTGWTLELRLGVRMLVRYPGLTVVGSLAMAFAIVVGAGIHSINAFAVLLLIVACGNVAFFVTRTATREREILVSTALGATRARILTQFWPKWRRHL